MTALLFLFFTGAARADLGGAVAFYIEGSQGMVTELEIIKANAGACGFAGNFVVPKAEESIRGQRDQVNDVTRAITQGLTGRPLIETHLVGAQSGAEELHRNVPLLRKVLSGTHERCQQAAAALDRLLPLTDGQPARLRAVLDEWDAANGNGAFNSTHRRPDEEHPRLED